MRRVCWIGAVAVAACGFDASGVAESGADESTSGAPGTSSTGSTSTAASSTTMMDGGTSNGESTATSVDASTSSGGDTSSSSGAEQGESTSTGEPEACVDLLWVSNVADPVGSTDEPLQDHLERLGYEITRVIDDESQASDADGRCAVLISAVSDSADVADKFHDVAVPVIVWEFALFDDMGFAVNAAEYDLDDGATQIRIVDGSHPLAVGFDDDETVTLYEGIGRINWARADGAAIVGVRTDDDTHASLFAYETDDELADGSVAPAKRAGLPFCNAEEGELQPAALDILANAVAWATAP